MSMAEAVILKEGFDRVQYPLFVRNGATTVLEEM